MSGWALAARYARRELRSGLSGFRVFIACLTLGVAAIAGVGTLSESIKEGLRQDARGLNGGDVSVSLVQRPASDAERARLAQGGRLSETIEMRAMARVGSDGAQRSLVELKAVEALVPEHEAKLLNYQKATPYEVGLLLNFGPKPQFNRKAFDNVNKGTMSWTK